ncbi:hypothetical protein GBAR_LOCUS20361, partial [Geodia barretti]
HATNFFHDLARRGDPHVTLRVCLVRTAATIVLESPRSKLQLGFMELRPQLTMFQGVPDDSPSVQPFASPLPGGSLLTVVADNKNPTLFLQSQGPTIRSTTALLL